MNTVDIIVYIQIDAIDDGMHCYFHQGSYRENRYTISCENTYGDIKNRTVVELGHNLDDYIITLNGMKLDEKQFVPMEQDMRFYIIKL